MTALGRQIPPAFQVAAQACVWPRRAEALERLKTLAQPGLDWDHLLRVVRRHRIAGLVHDSLRLAKVEPPASFTGAIAEAAQAAAWRSLRLARESLRLSHGIEAAGAPVLVLKGATLEMLAYGRLGLKEAWDIDLYVPPEAVETAIGALRAAGYERSEPSGLTDEQFRRFRRLDKEAMFTDAAQDTAVELHWGLTDVPTLLQGLQPFRDLRHVELAPGETVRTLGPEALFAYLCVHGARHGWSRLKWLADLSALLAAETLDGRGRLHEAAVGLGAGRCPGQGLLLCEALFGLELPEPLGRQLRTDRQTVSLADVALETLLLGQGAEELRHRSRAQDRISLSHFRLHPSWRHLAAETQRKMTSAHDFCAVPLPSGLAFAYPLLRLPLALRRRWMDARSG